MDILLPVMRPTVVASPATCAATVLRQALRDARRVPGGDLGIPFAMAEQIHSPHPRRPAMPEQASAQHVPLKLDQGALDAAKNNLEKGAITPAYAGEWRQDIIKLLNDSLATELVCILRYKRHHFTAKGLASPAIADEFLVHANEETEHADMIAERIVQLGGEPDFNPASLLQRSHADYDESKDLKAMIRANLVAERVAIEAYTQMAKLIGDKDSTTRRIVEHILSQEQEHAEELSDWLDK
jgi:bacterioferritin